MTDSDDSKPQPPVRSAPGRKNSQVPSATGIRRAAMDWLARREHARCEIEQKLRRRFPDATAAIGPVLDQLEHEGLLSDVRFVEMFTRSRIQRGQGPRRIAADLNARGVRPGASSADDANAIDTAGATGAALPTACTPDMDWLAIAREARRRRFGEAYPAGPVERNRQMAFLLRRGFTTAVCRSACVPPTES